MDIYVKKSLFFYFVFGCLNFFGLLLFWGYLNFHLEPRACHSVTEVKKDGVFKYTYPCLSQFSVISQPYLTFISAIFKPYIRHITAIFLPNPSNISYKSQQYLSHIPGISQAYLSHAQLGLGVLVYDGMHSAISLGHLKSGWSSVPKFITLACLANQVTLTR